MESNDQRGRDRLDGWKEIAAFLARDVRTAQRWERELGLPVHRKGGSGRPSIFAFVAELEAWLATDREQGARLTAPWLLNRRIALLAACCTVGFILGVSWLLRSADSVPVFRPDGWILVLDLENETQDPDLSETLKFALRRELRRSSHVHVASTARVRDALRFLDKTGPAPRLDPELGREIARLDDGIGILVSGRIRQRDGRGSLELDLLDPVRLEPVASMTRQVGLEQVGEIVPELSAWVLEALGVASPEPLESARPAPTTSSLRALNLYSHALTAIEEEKRPAAEQLLRDAVAADPQFASAYIYLAWVVRSRSSEFLPYAERALELADHVSDRERYFIQASYYHMTGGLERAVPAYEALVSLAPDHFWGNRNLLKLCEDSENWGLGASIARQMAANRPWHFLSNYYAMVGAAVWLGRVAEASPYVDRIEVFAKRGLDPYAQAMVDDFRIFQAWYEGDLSEALARTDALAAVSSEQIGEQRFRTAWYSGYWYLALGQIQKARRVFSIVGPGLGDALSAVADLVEGDRSALRAHMQAFWNSGEVWWGMTGAMLSATVGLSGEVEHQVSRFLDTPVAHRYPENLAIMRGALAFSRGDVDRAIAQFKAGLVGRPHGALDDSSFFLAQLMLADALRQTGRDEEAARTLAEVPRSFAFPVGGPFWVASQIRLAECYRDLGRRQDARGIESRLAHLLRVADPGFKATLRTDATALRRTSK